MAVYHPQLSYCISQYVEKDPETIITVVQVRVDFMSHYLFLKRVGVSLRVPKYLRSLIQFRFHTFCRILFSHRSNWSDFLFVQTNLSIFWWLRQEKKNYITVFQFMLWNISYVVILYFVYLIPSGTSALLAVGMCIKASTFS